MKEQNGCLAGFVALASLVCLAQAQDTRTEVLEVTVSAPGVATVGQKTAVVVTIRNVSGDPVDILSPKYASQFLTTVSATSDRAVLSVAHSGLMLVQGKYPGGYLKSGDEMKVEVWHIFADTGWHTLRCVFEPTRKDAPWFSFWEGRVESKPVSVNAKVRKVE